MANKRKCELSPEARKARNKYHKEWAARNPDKVKEINRRFWERKAQAEAAETGAG